MNTKRIVLLTVVNALIICSSLAQLSLDSFSANVGTIRTTHSEHSVYSDYQYAFYPELQIGGTLFLSYFKWTTYWGYWSDGITEPLDVMDMVTYSGQTHILGARVTFHPAEVAPEFPLPVGIFAGFAHHFISVEYVGGLGFDGKPGHDYTQTLNTFELGLNIDVSVLGPINLRGEVHQLFPLGNESTNATQRGRRAYKVGLALQL